MNEILEKTLLYDFYGELLTEHQREVYGAVVLEDYSISEVAKEFGVSRQGVHDLIKRSTRILEEYEEKLHLVERFLKIRSSIRQIRELTEESDRPVQQRMECIAARAEEILEEL